MTCVPTFVVEGSAELGLVEGVGGGRIWLAQNLDCPVKTAIYNAAHDHHPVRSV